MTTSNKHLQRIIVSEKEKRTLSLFENVFTSSKSMYLDMGFHITLCSKASDTLKAFENAIALNSPFAIAFIDMELAEETGGISIADSLRKMDPLVEMVIMTGENNHLKFLEKTRLNHPPDKICHLSKPCEAIDIHQLACVLAGKWQQEKRLNSLMAQLKKSSRDAEELNSALSHLTESMNKNRAEIKQQIAFDLYATIVPIVKRLRDKMISGPEIVELDMIEHHLGELLQDICTTAHCSSDLTSSELRIAYMIKNGFSNKKIANKLYISTNTVKTHRKNIRRKLGITNSSVNLKTFLANHMQKSHDLLM